MNITLSLLNHLGDEIGDVDLDMVRIAPAGTETATPNLAGQMSQLIDRLHDALAGLSLVPALAPLEVRIAVSRALLEPTQRGIVIPLQVRATGKMAARETRYRRSPDAAGGAARGASEWDGLFDLNAEEGSYAGNTTVPADCNAHALGRGRLGDLDQTNQVDEWETLGRAWEMDDDEGNEEGGWK